MVSLFLIKFHPSNPLFRILGFLAKKPCRLNLRRTQVFAISVSPTQEHLLEDNGFW